MKLVSSNKQKAKKKTKTLTRKLPSSINRAHLPEGGREGK